jgi:hypothetical protein
MIKQIIFVEFLLQSHQANGYVYVEMFYSFLFVQKRTKKAHPEMKTAHFRERRFD